MSGRSKSALADFDSYYADVGHARHRAVALRGPRCARPPQG